MENGRNREAAKSAADQGADEADEVQDDRQRQGAAGNGGSVETSEDRHQADMGSDRGAVRRTVQGAYETDNEDVRDRRRRQDAGSGGGVAASDSGRSADFGRGREDRGADEADDEGDVPDDRRRPDFGLRAGRSDSSWVRGQGFRAEPGRHPGRAGDFPDGAWGGDPSWRPAAEHRDGREVRPAEGLRGSQEIPRAREFWTDRDAGETTCRERGNRIDQLNVGVSHLQIRGHGEEVPPQPDIEVGPGPRQLPSSNGGARRRVYTPQNAGQQHGARSGVDEREHSRTR